MGESDKNRVKGCTCFRLRRTTRRITQIYDQHLQAAGLTLTQYSLLAALARQEQPPSMQELADLMGMDRTSLTRTLKPLEERGLLALSPATDRRRKAVQLSADGLTLREQARPFWRAAQDDIQDKLGKARTAELHKLLDQAFERLSEAEA